MKKIKENYRGHTIILSENPQAPCPRNGYQMGTLALYSPGHPALSNESGLCIKDIPDWSTAYAYIMQEKKPTHIMGVINYGHSRPVLRASRIAPNEYLRDENIVGFIYTTDEQIRRKLGKPLHRNTLADDPENILAREVAQYSSWINGEVYSYAIINQDKITVETNGHWYGIEQAVYAMDDAKARIDEMDPPQNWYVCMTDEKLSGWGVAYRKRYRIVLVCNSLEGAFAAYSNASRRNDLTFIELYEVPPEYYNSHKVNRGITKYRNKQYYVEIIYLEDGDAWLKNDQD